MDNPFLQHFPIKYPIIGAPMFLVSDENLVTSVSEAGGLGAFPALNYRPLSKYRKAIQEIKKRTHKPFGINIIAQASNKYRDKQLDIALEEDVSLIITSLGAPGDMIRRIHQTKTKVYCDVIHLRHAQKVADAGADGLVAISSGAGGHAGTISPFALIPYLKQHIKLPIVAAGSIVDGKGMLAALALGASAIYMGTRFIASKESPVSEEYKQAIIKAQCEDIVNTERVDGFPGNFIMTDRLKEVGIEAGLIESMLNRIPKFKKALALLRAGKVLFKHPEGKISYQNIFSAGQGVGNINEILPAKDIIVQTMGEYEKLKQSFIDKRSF